MEAGAADLSASLTGCTFDGNGGHPLAITSEAISEVKENSWGTNGKNSVRVHGDGGSPVYVDSKATFSALSIPWYISETLIFYYADAVFDAGADLCADTATVYLQFYNNVTAVGTSAAPITFSSCNSSPAAGDWGGIYAYPGTGETQTYTYTAVSYGGGSSSLSGNIHVGSKGVTVSNSTISYGAKYGIYKGSSTSPTLTGNTYVSNTSGDTN